MNNEDPFLLFEKLEEKVRQAEGLVREKSLEQASTKSLPLLQKASSYLTKQDLLSLIELQNRISSSLNLSHIMDQILSISLELLQGEGGAIFLDGEDQKLAFCGANRGEADWERFCRILLEGVLTRKEKISFFQPEGDKNFRRKFSIEGGAIPSYVKALLAVPLCAEKHPLGALFVVKSCSAFSKREEALIDMFSQMAVGPLSNGILHKKNKEKALVIEDLNARLLEKMEAQSTSLEDMEILLQKNQQALQERFSFSNFIGNSPAISSIYQLVEKIRNSNLPVLIQGESGTGKELVARAIHFTSDRKSLPFLSENCGALSESLLESELFGYEKGAFSGAERSQKGLFELAGKGTLFLDEVGEMSWGLQKKILRVLQEYEVRPLGSSKKIKIQARILAATNANLYEMVQGKTFRQDLYYRLNGVLIQLPPLREREGDIPLLIQHFLKKYFGKTGLPKISKGALKALSLHDWPGNVRELENEVRRWFALNVQKITLSTLLPTMGKKSSIKTRVDQSLAGLEKSAILKALQRHNWNKARVARELEIDRTTLYAKIHKYCLAKD